MAALSLDFFRSCSRYGDALKFASKPSYIFFLSSVSRHTSHINHVTSSMPSVGVSEGNNGDGNV